MKKSYSILACALLFSALGVPVAQADSQQEFQDLVQQMDQQASEKNMQGVLEFYSKDFKSNDGLNREATAKALESLWKSLEKPQYKTEVTSVTEEGSQALVKAKTSLAGSLKQGDTSFALKGETETLSRFERLGPNNAWQLVKQEVLMERSSLTSGKEPPKVSLSLPSQVAAGSTYTVEAVLDKPLRDSPALGGINQTPLTASAIPNMGSVNLNLLSSGGIFASNKVPKIPQDQVVSLGFVNTTGTTFITQRIKVTAKSSKKRRNRA
ncbi:MAG: hypothetical protein WCA07_04685 [Gloeobacterales cyanobacterium]